MSNVEWDRTIPQWLFKSQEESSEDHFYSKTHFLRRTMKNIAGVIENELYSENYAGQDNFLQMIDPRIKTCTFLIFMIFGGMSGSMVVLTMLSAIPLIYAKLSGLSVKSFFKRIWLIIPLAVFLVSLPGASSLLIQGPPLFYLVPPGAFGSKEGLYFCAGGLKTAFRLMFRTGISLSFAFLLLLTTRWADFTSGLRAMHFPSMMISILNMAYRYIFLLAEIAQGIMQARYLRTVGTLKSSDNRHFMANSAAHLFVKGHFISEEIYEAMCCRCYTGEAMASSASKFEPKDIVFLLINFIIFLFLLAGEHVKL